jgi:hypothetical protein
MSKGATMNTTTFSKLVSARVRDCITGSCVPANSILALDGLTADEQAEANRYFAYAGGLLSAAAAETANMAGLDA